MPRCLVIVLDSGGIGALPDALAYGDAVGANTIGNVAAQLGGLRLRHLQRLGLGNLTPTAGVPPTEHLQTRLARLASVSKGKDTVTGHWEMMGIRIDDPFPIYPKGFPSEVVAAFAAICGCEPLGNVAASGTEIIEELGRMHMESGRPILYTSADSVFQVAAHEDVVPLETLYHWCEQIRAILIAPHRVNRVIARPFVGTPGSFLRTAHRRDFAVDPPRNLLDDLSRKMFGVHAVGKVCDIFGGRGISDSVRAVDNEDALVRTCELLDRVDQGMIFVNLNDFDTKYGHRRDVRGYGEALERLDLWIPRLEARLRPGDRAIFTADHGCDPTARGSDHTREYVPFIELGGRPGDLGIVAGLGLVGDQVLKTLTPASVGAA
ncbi:MAG TPA: phosphopentomutase [Candidatus Baltobacteraceae bacterium]|jgi:phosphopentomutase|nr:phosphopentomutase [Candidatus Baltobacteraceae bacterium]